MRATTILFVTSVLAACGKSKKSEPLPAVLEAKVVGDHVELEVTTEPGAEATVSNYDYDLKDKYTIEGIADANGHATLTYESPEAGKSRDYEVYVSLKGRTATAKASVDNGAPGAPGFQCKVFFPQGQPDQLYVDVGAGGEAQLGQFVVKDPGGGVQVKVEWAKVVDGSLVGWTAPFGAPELKEPRVAIHVKLGAGGEGDCTAFERELYGQLRPVFEGVAKRPLPATTEGTGGSVLFVPHPFYNQPTFRIVGAATTLGEVALIVVEDKPTVRKISCGTYGDAKHRTKISSENTDFNVSVYDRRTGKRIEKKTFKADTAKCESSTTEYAGDFTSMAKREELEAYVQSLAK